MDLRTHRVPPDVFSALAEGHGSAKVAALVAAQHSKHILLLRQVVKSASAAGHQQAGRAGQAYELLAEIQSRDAQAVDAVADHPAVGSWAAHTIRLLHADQTRQQAVPEQLAGLAVAAAIRAGASCSVDVPVLDGLVTLPSVGTIVVPSRDAGQQARLTVRDGQAGAAGDGWAVRIPGLPSADQPGWRGLRRLSASASGTAVQILIDDLDPYRMPGAANIGGRLSAAESDRWQSVLSGAWDLLVGHHGPVAAEIAAMVRVFTPLTTPSHGLVSGSSRETFGSIALSAPPDAGLLAVTLAHEIQHAKLSALLDFVPMTLPDDGARHYAPWRDDPRPVSGLLQGAYAFLGVAAFWRRQRWLDAGEAADRAHAEFARWRSAVQLVVDTLATCGRLTPAGGIFVAGMARTLGSWAQDRIPPDATAMALRATDEHLLRWRQHNAGLAATPTN